MKTFAKIALRATISSVVLFPAASCASRADLSGDPCNYDASFCIYPVYQGTLSVGGVQHEGHFRYRFHENKRTREYWVDNGWYLADETDARTSDGTRGTP